jgi:hypothetical protein
MSEHRTPLTGVKGFVVIVGGMVAIVLAIWALGAWAAGQG